MIVNVFFLEEIDWWLRILIDNSDLSTINMNWWLYNTDLEISDLSQSIDMPGYARNHEHTRNNWHNLVFVLLRYNGDLFSH
jgi:hypothetical protein